MPLPVAPLIRFLWQEVLLTLVLAAGIYVLQPQYLNAVQAEALGASLLFFTPATLLAFAVAIGGPAAQRFKRFLAGSGAKLALSLIFLVWGFLNYQPQKVIFVVGFLAVYVIYTSLEVAHIMANLRRNSRSEQL